MFRYFVVAWDARDMAQSCAAHTLIAHLARKPDWSQALNSRGLAAFVAGARARSSDVVLLHTGERERAGPSTAAGAILGTLFSRNGASGTPGRVRALGPADSRAIVASGGELLLQRWWGRYVALIRDPDGSIRVLRDPSGTMPCFRMQLRGLELFFADVEDCLALEQVPLSVDWSQVAAFVTGRDPTLPTMARDEIQPAPCRTGLAQVSELEPGECIELHDGIARRTLAWDPAIIAGNSVIEDSEEAARELSRRTRECVRAWASCYPAIVHSLSGGLDSSIVLACLAQSHPPAALTCLHHFGTRADEDERRFAQLAAGHFGIALAERPLRPEATDLKAILGVRRSPRLSSYIGSLQRQPHQVRLARQTNAQAIFTGAGGDGLFFQSGAELAVADFARSRGLRPALLGVAIDAALLSRRSAWALLGSALRPEARKCHARSLWLQSASAISPGKGWQVASLSSAPSFQDPLGQPDDPERTHPLLSQPLIELCLRIPTWLSIEGGWDRSIARRAFSSSLPAAIVQRRAKGSITHYSSALLDNNLSFVRELLLDGLLVRERILDRHALERALAGFRTVDVSNEILHTHVSAEAWARRWVG